MTPSGLDSTDRRSPQRGLVQSHQKGEASGASAQLEGTGRNNGSTYVFYPEHHRTTKHCAIIIIIIIIIIIVVCMVTFLLK